MVVLLGNDLPLFNQAIQKRNSALQQVEDNSGDWFAIALIELRELKHHKNQEFTGEQLRRWLTPLIGNPHSVNTWGALIMKARREGVIEPTGRYAPMQSEKSHGRETKVYRWCQ